MEWSKADTARLVELFREKRVLWDITDFNFKDRSIKHDAWAQLGGEMQMQAQDVEKKMRCMIGQFQRELKKGKGRGGGEGTEAMYRPKWMFFEPLSFLQCRNELGHLQHGATATATQVTARQHDFQHDLLPQDSKEITFEVHNDYNDLDMDRKMNGLESPSATADLPPRPPLLATKRLKVESTRDLARQSDVLPACTFLSTDRDDDDDEYFYISKAWSAKLKRLAPDQQMFAEKAINDVLFEAGLGTLHKYSVQINEILPVNINHLSTLLKDGTTVSDANNMDSKC